MTTYIPGLRIGHDTDLENMTGVTVLIFDAPARAACEVRGSAPGTRETDLLAPTALVQEIHALVLAGGSAFGLAAADGVMSFLARSGVGFSTPGGVVPIVPAAVLYDLTVGNPVAPDANSGRRAAENARSDGWARGRVGAGTGATIGKLQGPHHARSGGIGIAADDLGDGTRMVALSAVNALGDVLLPGTGKWSKGLDPLDLDSVVAPDPFTNTTLTAIVTTRRMDRVELLKVAQMAHDGMARAIEPSHTPYDGDVIFVISIPDATGRTDLGIFGARAARAVSRSIVDAIQPDPVEPFTGPP